jgi:glutamine synthetase
MEDAEALAEKTYVNVDIHRKENEEKLKNLAQLPDSCAASADCLENQRSYFEAYGVFSPAMIDGIIKRLRAYDDRTLRHDVQGKPEAMQKLVNSYFHCG